MSSMLVEMITSTVIFGVLALTVARVQANINVTMFENQHNVVAQTNSVELARQIELDFAKIVIMLPVKKSLLLIQPRFDSLLTLKTKM